MFGLDGHMDVYDTIESILDSNGREIKGSTAIQKLVYLAKEKIPELDIPKYKAHYFGPYSPEVGQSLEKLTSYLFVSERVVATTKFEGYHYKLTDDGKKIMELVKKEQGDQYEKIFKFVKACRDACGLDISSLSFAAKILFVKRQNSDQKTMSHEELKKKATEFGWDIKDEQIDKGTELLKELQL